MKGYQQAIENMAYVIDQLSIQTLDPIMEEHGVASPEEAGVYMSDEDLAKWDEVERVANVICQTYSVEYDDFMNEVAGTLTENLIATTIGVQ
jgi:hypothetical protein